MSKAAMGVAMGAGAVLLAYLAYRALSGSGGAGQAAIRPTNPGGGFTSVAPGEYLSTDQLIYGSLSGSPYNTYATTDELIQGVIYGTAPGRSVIKVGYW